MLPKSQMCFFFLMHMQYKCNTQWNTLFSNGCTDRLCEEAYIHFYLLHNQSQKTYLCQLQKALFLEITC